MIDVRAKIRKAQRLAAKGKLDEAVESVHDAVTAAHDVQRVALDFDDLIALRDVIECLNEARKKGA